MINIVILTVTLFMTVNTIRTDVPQTDCHLFLSGKNVTDRKFVYSKSTLTNLTFKISDNMVIKTFAIKLICNYNQENQSNSVVINTPIGGTVEYINCTANDSISIDMPDMFTIYNYMNFKVDLNLFNGHGCTNEQYVQVYASMLGSAYGASHVCTKHLIVRNADQVDWLESIGNYLSWLFNKFCLMSLQYKLLTMVVVIVGLILLACIVYFAAKILVTRHNNKNLEISETNQNVFTVLQNTDDSRHDPAILNAPKIKRKCLSLNYQNNAFKLESKDMARDEDDDKDFVQSRNEKDKYSRFSLAKHKPNVIFEFEQIK
jgi:hypothetical protein